MEDFSSFFIYFTIISDTSQLGELSKALGQMTSRGFSQPQLLTLCEFLCIQIVLNYRELLTSDIYCCLKFLTVYRCFCGYLMATVSFQKMSSVCNNVVDSN